jgi:hypothetical protein
VNRTKAAVAASAVFWTAASGAALAHHSFAAEFDAENPVSLTGKVIELRWSNPHAHIYVEIADSTGTPVPWDFELGSPNALVRRGWSRTALKPGDIVTVSGYPAKTFPHLANARSVVMADGRTVFAESSYDNGPEK